MKNNDFMSSPMANKCMPKGAIKSGGKSIYVASNTPKKATSTRKATRGK